MAGGYRHRDFWRANVRPGLRGSILVQHQLLQGPHGRRTSTSTHSGGESKSREKRPMRPLAKRGDEASARTECPAGNALGSSRARHYPSGANTTQLKAIRNKDLLRRNPTEKGSVEHPSSTMVVEIKRGGMNWSGANERLLSKSYYVPESQVRGWLAELVWPRPCMACMARESLVAGALKADFVDRPRGKSLAVQALWGLLAGQGFLAASRARTGEDKLRQHFGRCLRLAMPDDPDGPGVMGASLRGRRPMA
jgi:hypothetical protein